MKKPKRFNWELARLMLRKADSLEFDPKDSNRTRLLKTIVKSALSLEDANSVRMVLEVLTRLDEIERTIQDSPTQDSTNFDDNI